MSTTPLSPDEHSVLAALSTINRRASPTELSAAIKQVCGLGMSVSRLYLVLGDLAARGLIVLLNQRVRLGGRTLKQTSIGLAPRGMGLAARCARDVSDKRQGCASVK